MRPEIHALPMLELIDALAKKLDKLQILALNAEYFLAEHFYSIRNDVDIECEERLLQLQQSPADLSNALGLNEQRTGLIDLINASEQQCLLRYSLNRSKLNRDLNDKLTAIGERLEKARLAVSSESESEMGGLSAFVQRLEDELDQEIHDFLSSIFGNKTLIFKRQMSKRAVLELGKLLMVDEYLNRSEIELVK